MKTNISPHGDRVTTPSPLGLFAVCAAIGLLAGCASEPSSVLVTAPPPAPPAAPVTIVNTPAAVPATQVATVPSPVGASSIIVMQAPPAAQQEVPGPRPSTDHVWVAGYWTWANSQYQWVSGRWGIPPRVGAVWIPPRWQPEGTSWRFYEGYWD